MEIPLDRYHAPFSIYSFNIFLDFKRDLFIYTSDLETTHLSHKVILGGIQLKI